MKIKEKTSTDYIVTLSSSDRRMIESWLSASLKALPPVNGDLCRDRIVDFLALLRGGVNLGDAVYEVEVD